jgi:integrase
MSRNANGEGRTVPLYPAVVTMLRRHKTAQAAEKLRAANQWRDSRLVFTNEFGGPVDPPESAAGD